MDLTQLSNKIKQSLQDILPGITAQMKMSPPFRGNYTLDTIQKYQPKESAVLILLYNKNDKAHVAFTQRHSYKGVHSGQISFPGGKKDPTDKDFIHTALREANEEIGVPVNKVEVLGDLTWLYVPPSNFIIRPVVGVLHEEVNFVKQESEVREILELPLLSFLNKDIRIVMDIVRKEPNINFEAPAYDFGNYKIWGATAMIMSEFMEIVERNI